MQRSGKTSKGLSDLYRVNPPSFDLLVKAILSGNFENYKGNFDRIQGQFLDEPYSKLISFLEEEQPLTSFSRQILVSESLEKITGTVIKPDMQKYRSMLLNFEKSLIILHFFQGLGRILNDSKLLSVSNNGIKIIQNLFEKLWGNDPTKNIIRPGSVEKPIDSTDYRFINSKIHLIKKVSKTIQLITEKSAGLRGLIKEISFLDKSEVVKFCIHGPLARASNILHPDLKPTYTFPVTLSHLLSQSVYSVDPDPINIIRIYTYEFALALERIQLLLPKIKKLSSVKAPRSLNGQIVVTTPVFQGLNHLSLEMKDYRIKYVNFIPFEANNALGIYRMIKSNDKKNYQFILLFLHPEILLDQKI